jgi:hypothetical protein
MPTFVNFNKDNNKYIVINSNGNEDGNFQLRKSFRFQINKNVENQKN